MLSSILYFLLYSVQFSVGKLWKGFIQALVTEELPADSFHPSSCLLPFRPVTTEAGM